MLNVRALSGKKEVLASGDFIVQNNDPAILHLHDNKELFYVVEILVNIVDRIEGEKNLEVSEIDNKRSILRITIPAGDSVLLNSRNPFGSFNGYQLHASFKIDVTNNGTYTCAYTFLKGERIKGNKVKSGKEV